jgi:hypothetical protein
MSLGRGPQSYPWADDRFFLSFFLLFFTYNYPASCHETAGSDFLFFLLCMAFQYQYVNVRLMIMNLCFCQSGGIKFYSTWCINVIWKI